MSSILNSISAGDLQVPQVPGDKSAKSDSVEILMTNSKTKFENCPIDDGFDITNTGFGEGNTLHLTSFCKKPKTKTPLYLENYLREFKTEEEKAAARNSLGLYNRGDVVTNSLLTLETYLPEQEEFNSPNIRTIYVGNTFISPIVSTTSVYHTSGKTLEDIVEEFRQTIENSTSTLQNLTSPSSNPQVTTLGDIQQLLKGFKNGNDLCEVIDTMNQEMLRFEQTGLIK